MQSALHGYCNRRGFASEAEDLSQEVFIRLLQQGVLLKVDKTHGRFRSLLRAVTRHVIGHHVERATALKRGAGRVQPLGEIDLAGPGEEDPAFDREWVAHLLEVALTRLETEHPNYHQAVKGYLLEGKTYAEIAEASGVSTQSLKNHIHRGRNKLIGYLREQVRDYCQSHAEYEDELGLIGQLFPD